MESSELLYYYLDPQGIEQGPFAASQMQVWLDIFEQKTPVRCGDKGPFTMLGEQRIYFSRSDSIPKTAKAAQAKTSCGKTRAAAEALLGLGTDCLEGAATSGSASLCVSLLEAGAEVDRRNALQRTPLHQAAMNNHTLVVTVLIDAGADVHAMDLDGCMPIHLACVHGALDTLKILVLRGSKTDVPDKHQLTPADHTRNRFRRQEEDFSSSKDRLYEEKHMNQMLQLIARESE